MKNVSFFLHVKRTIHPLVLRVAFVILLASTWGCYSFRGGSVPEHIATISIASVVDRSGFGDPTFREFCTETLINRFRSDNTVQLVDENGDGRLSPVLIRVRDQIASVQTGDLENQRRLIVAVEVEYFDAVKSKVVWKKTFENFDVYTVADATEGRRSAAERALRRVVDDILLAVVSDW